MLLTEGVNELTVGEKIRQYRKAKGLTQKELGKLSDTAETTIRQYEGGKRTPRIEQIEKIAKALELNPNDLTGWDSADTEKLSKEVEEIRQFETYLSTLGYAVQTAPDGERYVTKGRMTADFEQAEFDELQAKFFELNADIQTLIETRIQRKAQK